MTSSSASSLLSARDISVLFKGQRPVLDRVSLDIGPKEIVTIIGPNGAGKTTLLRVLLGLMKPNQGRVTRAARLRVGYMPQKLHIDPALPLTVDRFLSLWKRSSLGKRAKVLAEVGAESLQQRQIHGLSGGEFQRVLLGRALLDDPQLLVLDEPAQGVDVHGQVAFFDLIDRLRQAHGCSVLMVSHDLHLVMARTDTVICLNQHVCCSGRPHAVSRHPEYMRLFGRYAEALAVYYHAHDHVHEPHTEAAALAEGNASPACCNHDGDSHG